jgi:multiple sugar transport system substrate-binding protein
MKRPWLFLIMVLLALPLFAGGKQEPAAEAKRVQMSVIVRNYTLNQDAPYKTAKAEMEKRHPNVTVNLEGLGYDDTRNKTLITVGANQQLDVVQLDYIWVGEYATGNVLQKVTDQVKGEKNLLEDVLAPFRESMQWAGDYYGVWLNTDVRTIGWVKELVAAAGLDPEKAPATYEELVSNAMKAQKPPEVSGYFFPLISGEATVERWLSPLFSAGGQLVSADFKKAAFNSPAGVQALQFYVDCVNRYQIIPKVAFESEDVDPLMWNKRLVYCFDMGAWEKASEAKWTAEQYNKVFGTGVPPKFANGQVATTSGGYELGIPRTAADPKLSWEFIMLATAPANVKDFYIAQSRLGTRQSLSQYAGEFAKTNPDYNTRVKALQYTHFAPWNPQYVKMLEPLYTAIQKAAMAQATPKQALDEAASTINQILAQ